VDNSSSLWKYMTLQTLPLDCGWSESFWVPQNNDNRIPS
jgi:hypothetical protein